MFCLSVSHDGELWTFLLNSETCDLTVFKLFHAHKNPAVRSALQLLLYLPGYLSVMTSFQFRRSVYEQSVVKAPTLNSIVVAVSQDTVCRLA